MLCCPSFRGGIYGIALALLAAPALAPAEEPPDAAHWLRAMRGASLQRPFHGIAAHWTHAGLHTLTIRHDIHDGQIHERIDPLDDVGPAASPPASRHLAHDPATHLTRIGNSPLNLTQAERTYTFALGRTGRVAGRDAQEIIITPKDRMRYARRLWLDRATHLPLKDEILSANGLLVEQFLFARIEPEPAVSGGGIVESEAGPEQAAIDQLAWRVEDTPPGYRIVRYARHGETDQPVEHLLISDGLAPISLVVRAKRDARPDNGRLRHIGALHIYSRQIDGYLVTVMGEAPAPTLTRIARSLRPTSR